MSVVANNEIPFEPLILESNSNPTNNWCAREILRAIHIITKISSRLINSWKNGTTSQKVMGTVIAVYCTAATAYIIYLKAQENMECNCLEEPTRDSSLLNQFFEQKNHEHNGSLQEFFVSVDQLLTEKNLCEKHFYDLSAHESGQIGTISMHVCY